MDDELLQLPKVGDSGLHILTPTILEVDLITSKAADPAPVTNWNLVKFKRQAYRACNKHFYGHGKWPNHRCDQCRI